MRVVFRGGWLAQLAPAVLALARCLPLTAPACLLAGLVAALGPTVLLGTASGLFISNAWAVASERAVKAGACACCALRVDSNCKHAGRRRSRLCAPTANPPHATQPSPLQASCWPTCCSAARTATAPCAWWLTAWAPASSSTACWSCAARARGASCSTACSWAAR